MIRPEKHTAVPSVALTLKRNMIRPEKHTAVPSVALTLKKYNQTRKTYSCTPGDQTDRPLR